MHRLLVSGQIASYNRGMTTKNNPSGFGWSQGQVAPQAHVDVPHGLYEEEHGRRGFF